MIVDSSVWIAWFRGTRSRATQRLQLALRARESIVVPDVILMEVLQGARDPMSLLKLERALGSLPRCAPDDPRAVALEAARLYARCRWAGVTISSGNDCVIACIAIENGERLLHQDRDFPRIAEFAPELRRLLV